jgi:hypothetical protein
MATALLVGRPESAILLGSTALFLTSPTPSEPTSSLSVGEWESGIPRTGE